MATLGFQATDVLFILGAGASLSSGVPAYNSWRHDARSAGLTTLADVWGRGFPRHDLEDFADALDLCEDLGWRPDDMSTLEAKSVADIPFDDLREDIRELITIQVNRGTITTAYDAFAEQLWELMTECDQRVTILSMNWDTLLEDALTKSGIGYCQMGSQQYVGRTRPCPYDVRLIKPHGSLGVGVDATGNFVARSMRDWLPPCALSEVPLLARPGSRKRAHLMNQSTTYTKNSWHAVATALDHAGAIISVGYAWTSVDRELLLFSKHRFAPGRGVAFYNKDDTEAVQRGAAALDIKSEPTVKSAGTFEDLLREGAATRAMKLLLERGHGALGTWQAKKWLREKLGYVSPSDLAPSFS